MDLDYEIDDLYLLSYHEMRMRITSLLCTVTVDRVATPCMLCGQWGSTFAFRKLQTSVAVTAHTLC
jgi:hypothetical protein